MALFCVSWSGSVMISLFLIYITLRTGQASSKDLIESGIAVIEIKYTALQEHLHITILSPPPRGSFTYFLVSSNISHRYTGTLWISPFLRDIIVSAAKLSTCNVDHTFTIR